jgi:uncharacterized protein YbaR (Trm112 family)
MRQPRQRHIPLNIEERQELDRRKSDYEERTGDTGDWGKFLGIITLAGLAALGIYAVAPVARRGTTVWQVKCSQCGVMFPIQAPNPPPWRLAQVACPKCESGLVIDFASQAPDAFPRHEGVSDSAYSVYCHYCEQPVDAASSRVNPHGVEHLKCARCGRAARMRSQ